MKILISGLDSGGMGGAEKFLSDLATSFKRKGNEVSFISFKGSKFTQFLTRKKFNVYETSVRMDVIGNVKGFLKFVFFLPFSFWWNYEILAKAKKKGIKTVILSGYTDEIILSYLVKLIGFRLIWICFAPVGSIYSKNLGIAGFLYSLVRNLPDLIITPTEYSKKLLIEESGMHRGKFRVIPCGVRLAKAQRKRTKEGKIIGMVSRVEKDKGQDVLIKAFSFVVRRFPRSKLVIIGEGNTENLIRLAKRLGLEKKVEFKGWVDDVYKEIAQFDVFVFPSTWKLEGFGLVLVESMMLGVPVVTSNFGPIPEVTGDSALLVEPSTQNYSDAIKNVLSDDNLRRKLIKKGLKRAENFDIGKIATRYLQEIWNLQR